ncbi:hypothetical protein BaRGS_00035041 [Batillaria attramentaria]|uniref:Secreted protein n=1 Tax=Batillaria attramentaria TaxID=370345 RepID=A0ABD0JG28_9CAEN
MRVEVVVACLTLCLVEAGSSSKRRHLTSSSRGPIQSAHALQLVFSPSSQGWSGDSSRYFSLDSQKSHTSTHSAETGARDLHNIQSATALQRTRQRASNQPVLTSVLGRTRLATRADFLRGVLEHVAKQLRTGAAPALTSYTSALTSDTPALTSDKSALTSYSPALTSDTPSLTSVKRGSRYKCDFTRVTIQMIIEYLRSRRICGYRVNRMRFGLGGK